MTVYTDIDAALDGHLNDMPNLPPVAWENQSFKPTLGTLYLRPSNIAGDSRQASLGDTGQDENIGVYQIDVFAEAGKGKHDTIQKADLIARHFKRGTVLTYNDQKVRIRSASRNGSGGNTLAGWYRITVDIVYIVFSEARV